MIVALPRIIRIHPTMPAELNLPACLIIRKNDDMAAEQKFVLVSAIYM
jgi:hypothetical protein